MPGPFVPPRRSPREDPSSRPPGGSGRPGPRKSPLPLYLGIGGGAAALVLILVLAGGSGPPPRRAPPKPPPPPAPAPQAPRQVGKFGGQTIDNVGAIAFVCSGTASHEDREVVIHDCPKCGARDRFCAYDNSYYCYKCEAECPAVTLKCSDCGRPPQRRPRIKQVQ